MKNLKICYYSTTGSELTSLSRGTSLCCSAGGQIKVTARTQTQLFDQSRISAFVHEGLNSDIVILSLHGGKETCPAFDSLTTAIRELRDAGKQVPYLHIQPAGGDEESVLAAREYSDGLSDGKWQDLCLYMCQGGPVNIQRAFSYLQVKLNGTDETVPPPEPVVQEGLYHPDLECVPDMDTYFREHIDPQKPTIGLWFFQSYWVNGNLAHVDALIREIEKRGANVLPVFSMRLKDAALGNRGSDEIVKTYFMGNSGPRIDTLINVMSMSMTLTSPGYRHLFSDLNVPVLQAMVTSLPYAVWKESDHGMAVTDVIFQAAQPEFDGNLIAMPVAAREEDTVDPITGALLPRLVPIPDRVRAMASLAFNWARLRQVPNSQKRIAIVFHHYPPRNDRIGCAVGLDSFASVKLLFDRMADDGYRVERRYKNGDELSNDILERMTCDQRWLTSDQFAARSDASAGRDLFTQWHSALPETVRKKMNADWGEMPGSLFVHDDRLHFAGVRNGNIFITVQPPRGYLENPEAIYHDLHLSPPHHYLAHYRWIRDVFQAHAVMHVGKHGSLEWLPGKALGLSQECYPELAIMDLPNVYAYIINDPSEGTQAKRRSYCCIIDHLTPVFTNADLYEDLTEVDRALNDYSDARRQDPGKAPALAELLWEAVERADLHQDLSITKEKALGNVDSFVCRLHAFLSELSDTMISDGLHTLGQVPEGERLVELLVQLMRLPNGDIPSLREEILAAAGYSYSELLAARGVKTTGSESSEASRQLIAGAHKSAGTLIRALAALGFDPSQVTDIVMEQCGKTRPGLERALRYVAEVLVPNIRRVKDEIEATMRAFSGGFVPPGPSGSPTRGQADILPTGRNFYSIDPRMIPSPGAWEVGKALGDAILEQYHKQKGQYPDSVGILVGGGSTIRSKGDDIAEILYLLGVRPVWRSNGMVSGLEIVPASELGRPRIDVIPRITGFFRDAFPNLVELIDEAVQMVAKLEEIPDSNFVRRNVLKDMANLRRKGVSEDNVWRQATLRLFGCPPGTYGAGVAELVESRQWQTKKDLGEIYISYSAHAYGRGVYGDKDPQSFRKVLSRMDVTVKNEDSREYDMMSCTDFYNYYGGLIAAAATVRGTAPMSLVADSSDPKRIVLRTTGEEAKHVLRARLLNPKWLEGLKRHGYKGAGDISKVMDILLGWDATADVMEDWMYERVANKYALDPEMRKWLKKVNPYALQNILDKLLETIQRGMWNAEDDMRERLRDAYLEIEGDIEETIEGVQP